MESKNLRYFLALNAMPLLGPRSTIKLLKRWPSLNDSFNASASELLEAGLHPSQINQIKNFNWDTIKHDLKYNEQEENQTILTLENPDYPILLKEIYAPPIVLYAKGNLNCLKQQSIAIVGSRYPSYNGSSTAFAWSKALSLCDLTIVSGLAKGIDAAAHNGALDGSGKTIAVLGTGVDIIYPHSNTFLAKKIMREGLFLSEFPLKTPPKAGHFPQRNRIISGLTVATLVVEATLKSGSLITARFALEQNRDVFALPGSIYLPQSQGCHHLLKQGASLVTCYQDVLLELGLSSHTANEYSRLGLSQTKTTESERVCNKAKNHALCEGRGSSAKSIYDCIGVEPTHIDAIIATNNLPAHEVIGLVTELELNGKICAVPGGYIRIIDE